MAFDIYPETSIITGTDSQGNPIYDRAVNAEWYQSFWKKYFTNGVFQGDFAVTANNNMTVTVAVGHCHINGTTGYHDAPTTLTVTAAGQTARTDTVVLRRDKPNRNFEVAIKTGTTALTRNSDIWELALAQIAVGIGVTAITQANISDTRLSTALCGIVANAVQTLDTSTYYAQINADLAGFKSTQEADFITWLDSIKNILDQDTALDHNTAANLIAMINTKAPINNPTFTGTVSGVTYAAKSGKANNIMCGAITIPVSGYEGWAEIATSFTTPVAVASAQILTASDGKVIVTAIPVAGSKIRISIYSPTIPNANINVAYIIMDAAVV